MNYVISLINIGQGTHTLPQFNSLSAYSLQPHSELSLAAESPIDVTQTLTAYIFHFFPKTHFFCTIYKKIYNIYELDKKIHRVTKIISPYSVSFKIKYLKLAGTQNLKLYYNNQNTAFSNPRTALEPMLGVLARFYHLNSSAIELG